MKEYKCYKVEHDELVKDLNFIKFENETYDEAYGIAIDLKNDGYFIQDIEEIEDENKIIVWFS